MADWLKRRGSKALDIQSAMDIVSDILSGLAHLHAHNTLHRDVKPANILMQGNMPRITDFGISRLFSSTLQSNHISGKEMRQALMDVSEQSGSSIVTDSMCSVPSTSSDARVFFYVSTTVFVGFASGSFACPCSGRDECGASQLPLSQSDPGALLS